MGWRATSKRCDSMQGGDAVALQKARIKGSERAIGIATEWATQFEPVALVEAVGGGEQWGRASFQAEA